MKNTMIKVHELWLETLMAAFMSKTTNKEVLTNFSDILFRHFTWIENELIIASVPYSYDRGSIPIKVDNLSSILNSIITHMKDIDTIVSEDLDLSLNYRISTDLKYMISVIEDMNNEDITAFNMVRKYDDFNLSEEATDAFTLFLFEESYKEYELIMIYNYLKANSKDSYMNRIFQILIDESFFHLKSFGAMMAKMGILATPRIVMKELYQVKNIVQFLKDGIKEELAAKEECVRLSEAITKDSKELGKFFDFINYQENYHISLMEDALQYFAKENND